RSGTRGKKDLRICPARGKGSETRQFACQTHPLPLRGSFVQTIFHGFRFAPPVATGRGSFGAKCAGMYAKSNAKAGATRSFISLAHFNTSVSFITRPDGPSI